MLVQDNQAFDKNARVTATFGQGVIIRHGLKISVHAHVPKFGDSKGLTKQNFCERLLLLSPSRTALRGFAFMRRVEHPLICTSAHLHMAQHAKPSATVTGDSSLHKLRCIRARTRKYFMRRSTQNRPLRRSSFAHLHICIFAHCEAHLHICIFAHCKVPLHICSFAH